MLYNNETVIRPDFNPKTNPRFKVYYDNNPKNRFESKNRICLVNKETGYITRMNDSEALKIITDIAKALNWKVSTADREPK